MYANNSLININNTSVHDNLGYVFETYLPETLYLYNNTQIKLRNNINLIFESYDIDGNILSESEIALKINRPKAFRAVGTAIGNNPVSCLIPCHRVILSDGKIGNYYWGIGLKKSIIEWENHILVEYGNISTCIFDKSHNI